MSLWKLPRMDGPMRPFALAMLLLLSAPATAAPPRVTIVGPLKNVGFVTLWIAKDRGLFADEGLDVDFTIMQGGSMARAAQTVATKRADFSAQSALHAVIGAEAGHRLVIVAAFSNRLLQDLVVRRDALVRRGLDPAKVARQPLAERLKAMKGLRLAVDGGYYTEMYIRLLAEHGGLDSTRDLAVIPMGGSRNQYSEFLEGRVDGFMATQPYNWLAVQEPRPGLTLVDNIAKGEFPPFRDFLFQTLLTSPETIRDRASVVKRVARALRRADTYMRGAPASEVGAILNRQFPELDPRMLERSFQNVLPALTPNLTISKASFEHVVEFALHIGAVRSRPPLETLYTNDFVAAR